MSIFREVELSTLNKALLGRQPKHYDVFFSFLSFSFLVFVFIFFSVVFSSFFVYYFQV